MSLTGNLGEGDGGKPWQHVTWHSRGRRYGPSPRARPAQNPEGPDAARAHHEHPVPVERGEAIRPRSPPTTVLEAHEGQKTTNICRPTSPKSERDVLFTSTSHSASVRCMIDGVITPRPLPAACRPAPPPEAAAHSRMGAAGRRPSHGAAFRPPARVTRTVAHAAHRGSGGGSPRLRRSSAQCCRAIQRSRPPVRRPGSSAPRTRRAPGRRPKWCQPAPRPTR